MKIIGSRLIEARKAAGFRAQKALGDRVGLSQQAISDIENDLPGQSPKVYEIARAVGKSVAWLTGRPEGGPLKTRLKGVPSPAPAAIQELTGLIDPGNAFDNMGRVELPEPDRPTKLLPELDIRGGAAYGGGTDDQSWNDESGEPAHRPVAYWGLPSGFVERELGLRYGFADIVEIRGDSMDDGSSKALLSGDRAIVDRRDTDARQGGIFAVWDGEGVIVKQVELVRGHEPARIICKSLNSRYDPIPLTLDGSVRIIGRVAGRISRC